MKKLLSVIVAVYNVKPYISQCIDSICKQTYSPMEIILVDDGSTDGSGDICEEYAAKDQRIHVIHQKNKGLSGARNAALDVMQGDYMTIVDGDDYVLPDAFAHAIRIMEENDLDRCGFGSFRGGKGGAGSGKISLSLENEHTDRLRDCFIHERAINWGSVYKSALWEGVVILLDMYMKTVRWLTISLIESNAKALLINSITTTARRLQEYARLRW